MLDVIINHFGDVFEYINTEQGFDSSGDSNKYIKFLRQLQV
jgi:hypothetical protein